MDIIRSTRRSNIPFQVQIARLFHGSSRSQGYYRPSFSNSAQPPLPPSLPVPNVRHALVRVRLGLAARRRRGAVARAAGAAAGAEGPEERGGQAAGGGEPHVGEHGGAGAERDARPRVQVLVGGGAEAEVGGGGQSGEGGGEGGGHQRRQRGEERAQPAEEPADADEDFDARGHRRQDVQRADPLAPRGLIAREYRREGLAAQDLVRGRARQPPHLLGVEGVLQRARGAVVDALRAALAEGERGARHVAAVAAAVVPQADGVEVGDDDGAVGRLGRRVGEVVGLVVGELRGAGHGGGVGLQEVQVREVGVLGVGGAEADHDEEDEGHDGQDHGDEDAHGASRFAGHGRRKGRSRTWIRIKKAYEKGTSTQCWGLSKTVVKVEARPGARQASEHVEGKQVRTAA